MDLAATVFGGKKPAEEWFASPAMALEHRVPFDVMLSEDGRGEVEALLVRLNHGVYT